MTARRPPETWVEICVFAEVEAQDVVLAGLAEAVPAGSAARRELAFLRDRRTGRSRLRVLGRSGHPLPDVRQWVPPGLPVEVRAGVPAPWRGTSLPFAGPGAEDLVTGFLIDAGDLLLGVVGEIGTGRRAREEIAFDIMVAHLVAVASYLPADAESAVGALVRGCHPVPISFSSLRAHADGILAMGGSGGRVRAQLDHRYAVSGAAVERRARALLAQLQEGGPEVSAIAGAWHALAIAGRGVVQDALEAGRIVLSDTETAGQNVLPDPATGGLHALTASSAILRDYLGTDRGYLSMRLMMGLLYLALHAGLGIRITDRLVLCDAVTRSFEQLTGRTAAELMTRFVEALARDADHVSTH